jgi:hypothetical protein
MNPTQAIVEVILNMDEPHQNMLFNYLVEENTDDVLWQREWKEMLLKHENEQYK